MTSLRVATAALILLAVSSVAILAPLTAAAQTATSSLAANPVFQKNCAKCHGKTAEGRHFGGPSLVSEKAGAAATDDLRNIISNGKGRMPRYTGKLTPEEIDLLVQQIKAMPKK